MTPDWAAKPTTVPYAKFGDPQTLNLYAYVENGPVNRVDADGHVGNGQSNSEWVSPIPHPSDLYGELDDPEATVLELLTDSMERAHMGAVLANLRAQGLAGFTKAQNKDMSDKRTDVMLAATSVPPVPTSNTGVQAVMDYAIVPQANTIQELQNKTSELRNDKATEDKYSKMDVKLWESQSGGKWQWQGSHTGSGRDVLMRSGNDQRWYIDDGTSTRRVQLVIGKDSSGSLIKAWTVHVDLKPTGPVYSKID